MKRTAQFAYSLSIVFLLLLTACSQKRDKVVMVEDDDAEMNAAIAKARETLPQFWKVFDKPEQAENGFALKVQITDAKGSEHFWATDLEKRDGKIFGTINNDPNIVAKVKLGDRIEIPEADISDWMYVRDEKIVGNRTVIPLLKQMPAAQAAEFKKRMAEPVP